MSLPASMVQQFFDSKSFDDWRKTRESELKIQSAMVDRLNSLIQACGILAKTIARKR